jgi:hypothetical protein
MYVCPSNLLLYFSAALLLFFYIEFYVEATFITDRTHFCAAGLTYKSCIENISILDKCYYKIYDL